jgi:replicative DNA helicase
MNKAALSRLYYLNRETEQEKNRLAQLESAVTSASANITGLPHVRNINRMQDMIAEIANLRQIIKAKIALSVEEYGRITRYIETVADPLMRQILKLRHADLLSWAQVAEQAGGNNTADSVRKMHDRFVKE